MKILLHFGFFLIFINSYSQNEDIQRLENDCRNFTRDVLNKTYDKDFNCYIKGKDLHIDVEYHFQTSMSRIPATQINSLKDEAKEKTYKMIKDFIKILAADEDTGCNFQGFEFHINYDTVDSKRIIHTYRISYFDLYRMRDNINRTDVYRVLSYMY